ncbi:MAG TPA: carboxypeptidase-like regulatory domain-containing protein, partial [Planctomycetota bacterium]|nr:carboxypeptidase-like regulatory domain-containing protein [Planctomycetota bacterium]
MPSPKAAPLLVSLAVAAILALLWLFLGGDPTPADGAADSEASASTSAATLSVESSTAAELTAGSAEPTVRAAVAGAGAGSATIRGRVLDGWSLQPLAGVEVLAVTTLPNFERLETHLRSTMMGLWKPDPAPPRVLGSTMSGADGSFELRGLPSGRVFLDGRSERYFVRTPALVRLAGDETREGIELLCFPGGRVRGRVFGPEGTPVAGATVSVRPGPNAFLGQITSRNYRWLEGTTDASGYFDLHGVPEGHGYTVSAVGPAMALVEVHGVSVEIGQATNVDLHAVAGGTLLGKVVDAHGNPVEGAEVATVYLDLSRALFSGAGRAPVRTDADGQFVLHHVAPGPLALMAAKDGLGPSQIEQLEVVDGGVYDDFLLELGGGATVTGIVVDDREQPLADALVEIVPMERPQDPDVVKTVLRLREVTARTGRDGRFTVAGVAGDRILVQASKPGYVTRVQFGVRPSAQLRLALERGATVRGRVVGDDGKPIARFRVETTSREGGSDAEPEERRARRSMQGIAMGRQPREASLRLRAGSKISERRPGDEWQELHDAEGRFELSGLPPGKIRVRVRADGWLDPQAREVTLAAGETSDELVFQLAPGLSVRGVVVDAVTNRPVP